MSSKKPAQQVQSTKNSGNLNAGTSGVVKPQTYRDRLTTWANGRVTPLTVGYSGYISPSSSTVDIPPKRLLQRDKRPPMLSLAALDLAAPDRVAAGIQQSNMEDLMNKSFHGPGVAGAAGGVAGAAGNSMDHGNYDLTAPENLGDNLRWDEENAPRIGYQQNSKGGSRKRTKKYTNKRKRKRQTRRKTFRKRK